MRPQFLAKGLLVQLRHPDAVLVGGQLLGSDVHGDFRQVQVGADPPGGGDTLGGQHVPDHGSDQLMGGHVVETEVGRQVHKALIHAVHMNVTRGEVLQVDAVNLRGNLQVSGHPGHGGDVRHGLSRESLDLRQPLFHFKESGPPRHSQSFQGGGNRQTDGAVAAGFIRYHQVGGERIKATVYALHTGVKRFSVHAGELLSLTIHGIPPSLQ